MDPRSDAVLIERSLTGDIDAFHSLVESHSPRIYAALRGFGLTPDEGEDVAQEVFLRAWRGLAGFEGRSQLATWLYRIAYNEAQRCMARRPPAPVQHPPDGEDPIIGVPAAEDLSPERRTLDREFGVMLQRALVKLPDEWRAAVVLRDIEGLSTEEGAAAVGVGEAAFKSRLHRGRMQLRESLQTYLAVES